MSLLKPNTDLSIDLVKRDKIHDLAVAYISSRKDADKMSVADFYDAYIETADEMENLYNQRRQASL